MADNGSTDTSASETESFTGEEQASTPAERTRLQKSWDFAVNYLGRPGAAALAAFVVSGALVNTIFSFVGNTAMAIDFVVNPVLAVPTALMGLAAFFLAKEPFNNKGSFLSNLTGGFAAATAGAGTYYGLIHFENMTNLAMMTAFAGIAFAKIDNFFEFTSRVTKATITYTKELGGASKDFIIK